MNHTGCLIVVCIVLGCTIAAGCTMQGTPGKPGTGSETAGPAADAGIRIITEDLPPFSYAGAGGTAAGQSVDVVTGILARLNRTAQIEILPWSTGYNLSLAGPRTALFSTGRTDEREPLFRWVGPIASVNYVLYARNGSGLVITSLEAAKKAGNIGVVKDDARHRFLLENGFANITTCGSDGECLRSLVAGGTDLWLGTGETAARTAADAGIDPSAFVPLYSVRTIPLYIAFSRDTPDSVITSWQEALDSMKRDGEFAAIREQYGMAPAPEDSGAVSGASGADLALEVMAAETDGQLKSILRPLEVAACTAEARSGDWQEIRPMLAALAAKEPDAVLWYAYPNGTYYTVSDGLASANLKSRSYFPVVLAGNESVGIVVVSHATGRNAAVVAVPVMDGNAVTGVLGSSVYLDSLTGKIRSDLPGSFVFYAIDTESRFALHRDESQISRNVSTIGPETSFGQAIRAMRAEDSGTVAYDDGGIRYRARFRSYPLTGWRFVVAWPESAAPAES